MIRKFIPDFITSLNIACGIVGVVFAFKGRCDMAMYLMLAAAVFDFLDGFAARALCAYSDLGKELDSLCDVVSFGVLPSIMLYTTTKACMMGENLFCFVPLLIAVFSALRLAKFNVDTRQSAGFLGLPTPACALFVASLCFYVAYDSTCFLAMWMASPMFVSILTVALCALLVCEIPMFSMKFHKDDSNVLKGKRIAFGVKVLAAVAVCLICGLHWSLAVLLTFICYIVVNVLYCIFGIKD